MDRRDFLKVFSAGSIAAMTGQFVWQNQPQPIPEIYEDIPEHPLEVAKSILHMSTPAPDAGAFLKAFEGRRAVHKIASGELDEYLAKMKNFEAEHLEDVYLSERQYPLLISAFQRMDRVQNLVGHGNFNVLGFDDMLRFSKRYESVGAFTSEETDFIEELFTENASRYGFYGEKVIPEMTALVSTRDVAKISNTGHYLFKGDSVRLYEKVRKDVGETIVLTSGIRSVVKQTHLFMAKTIQSKGNLSRASRSLAPPGHSFHGIGDFDVGKIGLGRKNFTTAFARTSEFGRLVDLGYISMRYPQDNLLGVRFEPWHIKVV
jgi:hypothetical protein